MTMPDWLNKIVQEETEANPSDIPTAADRAYNRIRKHPQYKGLVEELIRNAVRELVYDYRHIINTRIKRDSGYYVQKNGATAAAAVGGAVLAVHRSCYDEFIGGTQLGELTADRAREIIAAEESIAAGHHFNAELLKWALKNGLQGDAKLRDVIPEKKLRTHFDRLKKEILGAVA